MLSATVSTVTAEPACTCLIRSCVPAGFTSWMKVPSVVELVGSPPPSSRTVPAPSAP